MPFLEAFGVALILFVVANTLFVFVHLYLGRSLFLALNSVILVVVGLLELLS